VIFSNAIQTNDSTDIPSLQDFVESLLSSRTISEGANNLYKMCYLFLTVAKLYLQHTPQNSVTQAPDVPSDQSNCYTMDNGTQFDLNSMTQFDPYLSALGLVPSTTWPITGITSSQSPDGIASFTRNQNDGGLAGLDTSGIGLSGGNQNSIQDWYSGSRYLMNLMEPGDDLQMPDLPF
jgi:hypothetical protein